jgi:hypothetical protein
MLNDSHMKSHFCFDGYIKVRNAIFGSRRIQGLFSQPSCTRKGFELVCVTNVAMFSPEFVDGTGIQPRRLKDELMFSLQTHAIAVNTVVSAT